LWNILKCFLSKKPLQVGYFYSYRGHLKIKHILKEVEPKYIYCQLIRVSEYVKNYHACPKTLDYMDALSVGMERRISKASIPAKWLFGTESKRLKNYERAIFDYFETKTIISEQDRDLIFHPNNQKIKCIPNGIDSSFFDELQIKKEFDLVFIGNLSYAPNVEAVEFIAKHILAQNKNLTCLISGATPNLAIQKICKNSSQITLQGWTEDIRSAYCKGKIFVAPMMIGTGMQNKLLEAMALGIPCITTSLANNAIKAIHGESIYVANTKQAFLDGINHMLSSSELYSNIQQNARDFVFKNYSWKSSTYPLIELIKEDLHKMN
jgi:glycosyltransferase involved in cell wall biosynthesis